MRKHKKNSNIIVLFFDYKQMHSFSDINDSLCLQEYLPTLHVLYEKEEEKIAETDKY